MTDSNSMVSTLFPSQRKFSSTSPTTTISWSFMNGSRSPSRGSSRATPTYQRRRIKPGTLEMVMSRIPMTMIRTMVRINMGAMTKMVSRMMATSTMTATGTLMAKDTSMAMGTTMEMDRMTVTDRMTATENMTTMSRMTTMDNTMAMGITDMVSGEKWDRGRQM